METKLQILYEDQQIAVCYKPPGIAVQTSKTGQQDLVSLLRNYYGRKKESTDIFVVHRLDQPVEGVMVFARTSQAAAALSRQLQKRTMDKYYLAVIQGHMEQPAGTLEHYLLRDGKSNTSKVVAKGTKEAKKAVLSYEVQKISEENSLIQVKLETGRHHQIRVQMAEIGHPLIGDRKYNKQCTSGYHPVGLCSTRIAFLHPQTGKNMEFAIEPKGSVFRNMSEKTE